MSTASAQLPAVQWGPVQRVVLAGLLAGSTDALFAVFHTWMTAHRFAPVRIFQTVASGVLGKASFTGGGGTALFGLSLHYLIALIWAAIFLLLVRNVPVIREIARSPHGAIKLAGLYGPFVWIAMYAIVLPLAGLKPGPVATWSFASMLIGHIFVVGLPITTVIRDGMTP